MRISVLVLILLSLSTVVLLSPNRLGELLQSLKLRIKELKDVLSYVDCLFTYTSLSYNACIP